MRKFDSMARLVPKGQQTVVIKVGTSSLLRDDKHSLNLSSLAGICETVRELKDQGMNVIIVSSGAVGVGCQRLGLEVRPSLLAQKQALAAVGQQHLMRYYDDFFSALGLNSAQVLLTLDNLANRNQYINARNTFEELLRYGAIPVVNENDTVAVEQLRFGDNDTLSAQVATLVQADWLFLLTDVNNVYTANPNVDPNATPIYEVHDLTKLQVDTSTSGTQWGTGGMATKLTAASIATAAGCKMAICNAKDPRNILRIIAGERVGTVFHPLSTPLRGRKRWILSVPVKGELWLDDGALRAVKDRHASLFSAGIAKVTGDFHAQDAVRLCDLQGREIGRGLINYTCEEVQRVKGMSSQQHQETLGYLGQEEVIHRANICLMVEAQELDREDAASLEALRGHSTTPPLQSFSYSSPNLETVPEGLAAAGAAGGGAQQAQQAQQQGMEDVLARLAQLRQREREHGEGAGASSAATAALPEAASPTRPVDVDMAARLAVLASRQAASAEQPGNEAGRWYPTQGAQPGRDATDANWDAELASAMAAERQAAQHAQQQHGTGAGEGEEMDITEAGWLPR